MIFNLRLNSLISWGVLVCLLSPAAAGQPGTRSLEGLMTAAVKNRALVKAYEAETKQSREDVERVRGRFFPSMDLEYRYDSRDKAELSKTDRSFWQTRLSVTQNLFAGFKDISDLRQAENQLEINRHRLAGIRQDIRLDVALEFLNVYQAHARLDVAQDALSLYRKENDNAALKYRLGLLKKNDYLKIKVEADHALQAVLSYRARLSQAINDLILKTVVRVKEKELVFDRFKETLTLKPSDYYHTLLLKHRSEIRAQRSRVKEMDSRVSSAKSLFYPRLDLVSEYMTRDDGPGSSDSRDESRISLQVGINLFDGFQKNRIVGKARLDVARAKALLTELERRMKTRLDNLILEFEVSQKNMDVAEKNQSEATENLRITRLAFEKGIVAPADLLDAIYYLSRAGFKLVDSRFTLFKNHFRIQRMVEAL